jgi:hypothetical protein
VKKSLAEFMPAAYVNAAASAAAGGYVRYGREPARQSRSTTMAQQPAHAVAITVSAIALISASTMAVYGVQHSDQGAGSANSETRSL